MDRDENGRFVKGNGGGPGRPKAEREVEYYRVLMTTCTVKDWKAIVEKAIQQALKGDPIARKWLADYLVGSPIERKEITGADGGRIVVSLMSDD